jgi:hypothetical protein
MKPELRLVTIVLLGQFDPGKFSIPFLQDQKAIGQADAAGAQIDILLPGQVIALAFGWGKLRVERERLLVETSVVPYVRVFDLAVKAVREIAPHSVVGKFGINVTSHFRFPSIGARDEFAMKLVPTQNWGAFGKAVNDSFKQEGDKHGGLMRVTMRQALPEGREAGWLDVTIEPSSAIENNQGVVVQTNDHHDLASPPDEPTRAKAIEITNSMIDLLASRFEKSVEHSIRVSESLVS